MLEVQQIMSQPPVQCRSNETLNAAAQHMWERDCGLVPVADDSGRLVGVVTDRDICMAAYTQGAALHQIPVSNIMAKKVITCTPEESVTKARDKMTKHQIRRIPVVDEQERVVGILSLADLADETQHEKTHRRKDITAAQVLDVLAGITKPRNPGQLVKPARSQLKNAS